MTIQNTSRGQGRVYSTFSVKCAGWADVLSSRNLLIADGNLVLSSEKNIVMPLLRVESNVRGGAIIRQKYAGGTRGFSRSYNTFVIEGGGGGARVRVAPIYSSDRGAHDVHNVLDGLAVRGCSFFRTVIQTSVRGYSAKLSGYESASRGSFRHSGVLISCDSGQIGKHSVRNAFSTPARGGATVSWTYIIDLRRGKSRVFYEGQEPSAVVVSARIVQVCPQGFGIAPVKVDVSARIEVVTAEKAPCL